MLCMECDKHRESNRNNLFTHVKKKKAVQVAVTCFTTIITMKHPIKLINKPTNLKQTLLCDVQQKKHSDRPKQLLIIKLRRR